MAASAAWHVNQASFNSAINKRVCVCNNSPVSELYSLWRWHIMTVLARHQNFEVHASSMAYLLASMPEARVPKAIINVQKRLSQ